MLLIPSVGDIQVILLLNPPLGRLMIISLGINLVGNIVGSGK